jgi:hypothetical protein
VSVDFSNYLGPLPTVTFNMVNVIDGWDLYSTSESDMLASAFFRGPVPIAQGNNGTDYSTTLFPNINSSIAPNATSGTATVTPTTPFVTVTALQVVCDGCPQVEIASITLPGSVPEPNSAFILLVGIALLWIGLGGKGRRWGKPSV